MNVVQLKCQKNLQIYDFDVKRQFFSDLSGKKICPNSAHSHKLKNLK